MMRMHSLGIKWVLIVSAKALIYLQLGAFGNLIGTQQQIIYSNNTWNNNTK
jgi:hypothetical protein